MSADVKLVAAGGSTLPTVRPLEGLELALASAAELADAMMKAAREGAAASLCIAITRVEALDLEDLRRRWDTAMKPATVREIAVLCARLVAGYPTRSRAPEFGAILFDEVAAAQPSVAALDVAVRRLFREEKFLPSIAETLEALGQAEWHVDQKRRQLAKIPQRMEIARTRLKLLARTPEEIERDAAVARERNIEACVEMVMSGEMDAWLKARVSGADLAEVRRRVTEREHAYAAEADSENMRAGEPPF
jgi:hypothetical protein